MSHKKIGPDRFSRFDVYWIQTNKQTDTQTDKPNLYIDIYERLDQIGGHYFRKPLGKKNVRPFLKFHR